MDVNEKEKIIEEVSKYPILFDGRKYGPEATDAWRAVSRQCGQPIPVCRKEWKDLLSTYKEEASLRKQGESSGSGTQKKRKKKGDWQVFDRLSFLREGTPNRKTLCSTPAVVEGNPLKRHLPNLGVPQRRRTPSESLNEKLQNCVETLTSTIRTPTSVEYALGTAIGQKIHDLPDGPIKWEWIDKLSALYTELQRVAYSEEQSN